MTRAADEAPGRTRGRRRFPLGAKLALTLLAVAAGMLVFLLAFLGPKTSEAFLARSGDLIEVGTEGMRRMAEENTTSSSAVVVELIHHTAGSRQRALADLPLSLYAGDLDRLRAAIQREDAARSARLERNVEVLAAEMERRAMQRIDAHVASLGREQIAMNHVFASELRESYLILVGAVLVALIILLGLGLYRMVVHPIRRLHAATHAVTRGDLDVEITGERADEIGALSTDFGRMVHELRTSRSEIREKNAQLAQWNERLEADVQRKTSQLIHAAKMASLGTLAGGVAHEFNNLVGGIRGCARELRNQESDTGRQELLDVILRATHRAAGVTEQLLRFSRRRVGEMRTVCVSRLLREVLDLVAPQAARQGVELRTDLAEPLEIEADAGALHQVFLNLITNALQAMPDGGPLQVSAAADAAGPSAAAAGPSAAGPSRGVVVRVTDAGVGIGPQALPRVFDPFFTTKEPGEGSQGGSGLGLAVSHGIVEAHGGTMQVESVLGAGSTFTTRLPKRPPPTTAN